nr:IS3 family transposase [Oligella ureolytica]
MYSYEQMIKAVKLYIKLGKRTALTIQTLGYPTKNTLKSWFKTYQLHGDLPQGYERKKTLFSAEQKTNAISHYFDNGCNITYTARCLGYPCRATLRKWLQEQHPELFKSEYHLTKTANFNRQQKTQAVITLQARKGSVKQIANMVGVSRQTLYHWKNQLLANQEMRAMSDSTIKKKIFKHDDLLKEKQTLEQQVKRLRMEHDILVQSNELLKKELGIDKTKLTNREKTQLVDTLKNDYPLLILLQSVDLARSTYFYNKSRLNTCDKYADVRAKMVELFHENYQSYGYRRIVSELKKQHIVISEKVIRRLMAEENLKVTFSRRKGFNAYCGEFNPAPENLLKRNFKSKAPNEKWLTDITEIRIPAGKVYLSPIVDCFDGLIASWSIGTSPNAKLVNTMLTSAISTLKDEQKPIIHSDRGAHYRWPEWMRIVEKSGLVRSMSRKGCSPDNAACEGFFGRFKNEFLYNRDWSNVSISELIKQVNDYIQWYNEKRIKQSLGYKSPIQYRQELGLIES